MGLNYVGCVIRQEFSSVVERTDKLSDDLEEKFIREGFERKICDKILSFENSNKDNVTIYSDELIIESKDGEFISVNDSLIQEILKIILKNNEGIRAKKLFYSFLGEFSREQGDYIKYFLNRTNTLQKGSGNFEVEFIGYTLYSKLDKIPFVIDILPYFSKDNMFIVQIKTVIHDPEVLDFVDNVKNIHSIINNEKFVDGLEIFVKDIGGGNKK